MRGTPYDEAACVAQLQALALALGRTPLARDWQEARLRPSYGTIANHLHSWDVFVARAGLEPLAVAAGWQVPSRRGRPYWTAARITTALQLYVAARGTVPRAAAWAAHVRGDARFPAAALVRAFGGGRWYRALERAGIDAGPARTRWTEEDRSTLITLAGRSSLTAIARRLGRTVPAVRRELYEQGERARDAQGELTGRICAAEYGVPVKRIYRLIRAGTLPARKGPGAYWQIDPTDADRCVALRTEASR